jgi:putative hydrolase of the HAD superfamily
MPKPLEPLEAAHPANPIQLVCLDLGGVLVRVCGTWQEACRAVHLELPAHLLDPAAIMRLSEMNRRYEIGQIDEAEFERQAADLTGLSTKQIGDAVAAWLKGACPGAAELVGRLGSHPHVRSACLSNTNPRHWRMMNSPGPNDLGLGRLTWRFVSYEVGHLKPFPAVFRHVERVSGLAPAQILFFDDNPGNVAAARACGWQAERIDPHDDPPGQVVRHLARFGVRL